MINPPEGGMNPAPIGVPDDGTYNNIPENPAESMFPNIPTSEEEQKEVVDICNKLKQSLVSHGEEKHRIMRDCYAYVKNQFVGSGDLLPIPSTNGNERDLDSQRPKVFIPIARQIFKTLFSHLKLSFFPNDEDYFRVRGKTPEAAEIEDTLTEGLKYKFKEAQISEKIGLFLQALVTFGNSIAVPCIKDDVIWEWQFDAAANQYVLTEIDNPPLPDVETFNPLDFYIDPNEKDPEKAKWGYFTIKKCQEIKDSALYFNKEQLKGLERNTVDKKTSKQDDLNLDVFNGFSGSFEDTEPSLDYDFYYFPYLKTKTREYRNMLVGVAGEQVLVRFHPNLFPRGMNPGVFCGWTPDMDSGYSTGPIEDIKELQRLVNIMHNYMVEVLARIGNRFAVPENTDISNLFGVAGGVMVYPEGSKPPTAFTGDYAEPQMLANIVGALKAEAQIVAGSQNPFQGASQIDFKKTATELQILQENSISVIREVIEHVGVMGVQRILERLMYLCADLYQEPMQIRVDDPAMGTRYEMIDFSVLKSGQFVIELVNINPSQSKQAQVASLTELLTAIGTNPQALLIGEPVVRKIGELQGVKNINQMLDEIKEKIQMMMGGPVGPQQPGVLPAQAGMDPNAIGGMDGVSPPLPPEAV